MLFAIVLAGVAAVIAVNVVTSHVEREMEDMEHFRRIEFRQTI